MLDNATQSTRHLAISTPLGTDELLLIRLDGTEELSELFEFEAEMFSKKSSHDPRQIVGQRVSLRITHENDQERLISGFVSEFRQCGWCDRATTYRAKIVPWLWFLTQSSDCRIFQEKTAPEIVEDVFRTLGFSDFEFRLKEEYDRREYCVQYRETDYQFVSRLLEEEGIFFYFEHDGKAERMIMSDQPDGFYSLPKDRIEFNVDQHTGEFLEQIKTWEHRFQFCSGRYSQQDFNFKTPANSLLSGEETLVPVAACKKFEVYDNHGRHWNRDRGRRMSKVRMEEIESSYDQANGTSNIVCFAPGGRFSFSQHRVENEIDKGYVISKVHTKASVGENYMSGDTTASEYEFLFENRFECIPDKINFRPKRTTPKPIVEGPQTAIVVGRPGDEICPDEFGRVKVQFHWDRLGRFDDQSSCWIRVSQGHAGQGWGGIDLPRVGEEVIVDFIEGDPDEPMITGRVYNSDNRPPFSLPDEMTRSGMKSQTHKGSGSNEISMDDTAGKEQIRVNAQTNMDTTVGNNATKIVNVDSTTDIGNNEATTVGVNASEDVGVNKDIKVGSNMTIDVGSKLNLTAGSSITLKCGASKIYMNAGGVITITGTMITTSAAATATVASPMTQVVGGIMCSTVGPINTMSGGACHVGALKLASVSGQKVDIAAAGSTSIKGSKITLN